MNSGGGGKVLLVDDEPNALKVLGAIMTDAGFDVITSFNGEKAKEIVSRQDVGVLITDLKMPGTDGMQLFEYVSQCHPEIPVIFLTAYGTVESAVHAMTHGALYYFIKPPDHMKLKEMVEKALAKRYGEGGQRGDWEFSYGERTFRIIGRSLLMRKILDTVQAVKNSVCSVLICGETGTGKEMIAKALHFTSMRKDSPFVAVNCAAIPHDLIEAELFGCEKGAYTGSVSKRIGKIEEASGGTLFLDEVGELQLPVQAKLLRVLQESEIERIGSNAKIRVDFRLTSSTNRDLQAEVDAGRFRKDLFYRLNVVRIDAPPLRLRIDDLPLLVSSFMKEFCEREQREEITISEEVMEVFMRYGWPGNVRQLRNVIERAAVLSRGEIVTMQELPDEFREGKQIAPVQATGTLKEMEHRAVREALVECGGNKSRSARMLGISRKAFYKKLKEFGMGDSVSP
jgi:DNA-binding NtrC family response regulator